MALEIVWTKRATQGYDNIIEYLEANWTEKEISNFIKETNDFFDLLKTYPELLQSTGRYKSLRRGPINRYTILTYRVKPRNKQIELINIRSSRQKPQQK